MLILNKQKNAGFAGKSKLVWVLPITLLLSGCTSLNQNYRNANASLDTTRMEAQGYNFDETGAQLPIESKTSSNGSPTVVLDVRNGKKHMERIPLSPEKPLFVADLIKDANLAKRLGKIDVTVIRETTPMAPPVRMDVGFDSSGRNVMQEQNYALQPNDRVIVRKDTSSFLSQVGDALSKSRTKPGH